MAEFVRKAKILLREFAVEFLNFVEERNVPLIVFSAGIGNIIEIILKKSLGHIPENLHIVANVMEFDQNNVLLIGDSLGDVDMDKGIGESLALKIGYLNRDFDVLLEKYLNAFDIVLIDCQSMEVPLDIFKLCQNKN
uniref:5'-nucleotidase n=1 Tax=Panagrolaimus sp. JU765 TaxID=591449 RepID=A0AC34RQV1_9BILA